ELHRMRGAKGTLDTYVHDGESRDWGAFSAQVGDQECSNTAPGFTLKLSASSRVYWGQSPLGAGQVQPERHHLLAVASQQHAADYHRVVPGLALDGREPREFAELPGCRCDQRYFPLLRQHQKDILIGEQD